MEMNENLYHKLADIELNNLLNLVENIDKSALIDIDYLDGILSITLPDNKQYIINKHSLTKKIWVSSPISSASYYFYDEKESDWISKDKISLTSLILGEIKKIIILN